jgi:hypothetical protein
MFDRLHMVCQGKMYAIKCKSAALSVISTVLSFFELANLSVDLY